MWTSDYPLLKPSGNLKEHNKDWHIYDWEGNLIRKFGVR